MGEKDALEAAKAELKASYDALVVRGDLKALEKELQNIEKLSRIGNKISSDCVKYEKSELNACTRKLDKILTSKTTGIPIIACNAWYIVLDNSCRCKLSERMVKQFVWFYKRETVYSF